MVTLSRTFSEQPRCWYWETVECLRRLALTGLLIFIEPSDGSYQVGGMRCAAAAVRQIRRRGRRRWEPARGLRLGYAPPNDRADALVAT